MIESFLTVGRQIITLYLLMAVGYVLGSSNSSTTTAPPA